MDATRSVAPGLVAAVAVAAAARLLTGFLPSIVAEVSVALLLGIIVSAVAGGRLAPLVPGLTVASQRLLRLGIVLLGARLSLGEIARIGLPATGIIVITMAASFAIVLLVSRIVRVEGRLAVLIAVGSAVCGNTAIVATAPVIGARAREVAYAVATITLFGTLAVFLYPAIGRAVELSQPSFGLWAGVAVHDTSQVIATSAAFGPQALDVATVVKLIRNALMAPLLLLIATVWASRVAAPPGGSPRRGIRRAIPLFVLGFLALAVLRTLGVIDASQAGVLDTVARTLILVALAAVGMSIHLGELRETSWRPLAVGFAVALVIGLGSLAAIVLLGLGSGIGR
ncbi:MAG: putative sulfate exporter family transporter [Chloroflexota bacterium]